MLQPSLACIFAIGLLLRNNATSLWTTGMRKKIGSTNHWILKLFSQSFGMDKDFAKCQFWDPTDEYLLPERCPHCRKIVSATELEEQNSDAVVMQMYCPHCSSEFYYTPQMARGDPRNQPIIIHEDGWNPNSTSSARHSIAAITIMHACMKKANRSSGSNARVYSFIPVNQLPREAPHKYDAFFSTIGQRYREPFYSR